MTLFQVGWGGDIPCKGDIPNRIPLVIPLILTGEGVNIPYGDYSPPEDRESLDGNSPFPHGFLNISPCSGFQDREFSCFLLL